MLQKQTDSQSSTPRFRHVTGTQFLRLALTGLDDRQSIVYCGQPYLACDSSQTFRNPHFEPIIISILLSSDSCAALFGCFRDSRTRANSQPYSNDNDDDDSDAESLIDL